MAAIDKQILDTFRKTIPQLSELDKEKLLAFGEGIAFKADQLREAGAISMASALPKKHPPEKNSA